MDTIGFVGAGNMAEALINGLTKAEIYAPADILISDIKAERLKLLAEKYGVGIATRSERQTTEYERGP